MWVCCLVAQSGPSPWPLIGKPQVSFGLGDSPGKNTGVSFLALLQLIFPVQGWNPGLLHSRQILYQLSHRGSSIIFLSVIYLFCRGTLLCRNRCLILSNYFSTFIEMTQLCFIFSSLVSWITLIAFQMFNQCCIVTVLGGKKLKYYGLSYFAYIGVICA